MFARYTVPTPCFCNKLATSPAALISISNAEMLSSNTSLCPSSRHQQYATFCLSQRRTKLTSAPRVSVTKTSLTSDSSAQSVSRFSANLSQCAPRVGPNSRSRLCNVYRHPGLYPIPRRHLPILRRLMYLHQMGRVHHRQAFNQPLRSVFQTAAQVATRCERFQTGAACGSLSHSVAAVDDSHAV